MKEEVYMAYVKKGATCNSNQIYGIMKLVMKTLNKTIFTWLYKIQYVIIICINFSLIIFQRGYFIDQIDIDAECDLVPCINLL